MELDHVLLAASDLEADAQRLRAQYGLEPHEGGRHPGWGTANWIIPLGRTYIELVAVVSEHDALESAFGRRVAEAVGSRARGAIGWAVRPDDLQATAARLGLEITAGSRTTPSGDVVAWHTAGLDEAISRPHLPFFIEWSDPSRFPGATTKPAACVERLELEGDADELSSWLGTHSLPLEVRQGGTGITAIVLRGAHGPITLGR